MQPVHKFLFDTSFDQAQPAAPPKPEPAAPPPEPTYTGADLAAAREEAFAAGKADGAAEARAGIEAVAAKALTAIAEALPALIESQAEIGRSYIRTATETAAAIARKLHPELARRHGLTEVEGVLRRCLEGLRDEPRLVVRVEDGLLDALETRIDPLARSVGFEGRVVLLADDTIAPGDCRVEWADGGVERNSAALWEDIDAAIGRALAELPSGEPRSGEAQPDESQSGEPRSGELGPQETPALADAAAEGSPAGTTGGPSEQA